LPPVPRGTREAPLLDLPRGTLLSPDPAIPDPPPLLRALIAEGLEELGLGTGEEAAAAELALDLARLAMLLDRWAQRMSLTGHRGPEAIARRLVLDALALDACLPAARSLADLGTGPGFPGLPLARLHPARRMTLVESRERPHHFQRAAVRALSLVNVRALRGRAEALPPEPHELAVAQAMARPERAVRWLLPWVAPDGWLAVPGGVAPPELPALPGLAAPETLRYRVPLGGPERTLWRARRSTG